MASLQGLDRKYYDTLLNYFNSQKVNGYLYVPKEYGMFVAGKEYKPHLTYFHNNNYHRQWKPLTAHSLL